MGSGTVINTAAIAAGSLIGVFARALLPEKAPIVYGIGLVTALLGIQMFMRTRRILVVLAAICVGGAIGTALRLPLLLESVAGWAKAGVGGDSRFTEGFVTASVLFCVGPMALLGCLQDALERKIELLGIKSLLDGVSSIFLAAAFGVGVMASAGAVLIFQGLLTLLARPLQGMAKNQELMNETVATGGVILVAIGLSIAEIREFSSVIFLPALVLAPAIMWILPRATQKAEIKNVDLAREET